MSKTSLLQYAAAGFTVAAIAFGAYAAGNARSTQATAGTPATASAGRAQASGQPPSSGSTAQAPGAGQAPPGFGTPATGSAAAKAAKAALARYPGSVEAVVQLQDGSYVVHVITAAGEYHVAVSPSFAVTGAEQRSGFPGGGPGVPPGAGGVPSGTAAAGTARS